MTIVVQDKLAAANILRQRRASGNDRWDEVWDGVYILMPNPNIEHQGIAGRLLMVFGQVIEWPGLGRVFPGVNVSDRLDDWTQNYRCPDVAVYLNGNTAVDKGAFWLGGPDLAVEIISPDDRSREKLDFYARVGVRELLLVDRDPWSLELYQRRGADWALAGTSRPGEGEPVASSVVPLRFRLIPGDPRPSIEVSTADGAQSWTV
jgi:Uma2 family endonuclease